MDKLKIADKKLTIHGADLNYSKQDYTGAQFRKFNFATNSSSYVNLIVPNGYLQDETEANMQKFKNKALGFMYTTNSENLSIAGSKKIRVGEVIVSDNIYQSLKINK